MKARQFILEYAYVVKNRCLATGILPSVILAQAVCQCLLYGRPKGFNMFGLVATDKKSAFWDGACIEGIACINHSSIDMMKYRFYRSYNCIEDSISDYIEFLIESSVYPALVETDSYIEQSKLIAKAFYQREKDYTCNLVATINIYHLYDFDSDAF